MRSAREGAGLMKQTQVPLAGKATAHRRAPLRVQSMANRQPLHSPTNTGGDCTLGSLGVDAHREGELVAVRPDSAARDKFHHRRRLSISG